MHHLLTSWRSVVCFIFTVLLCLTLSFFLFSKQFALRFSKSEYLKCNAQDHTRLLIVTGQFGTFNDHSILEILP